MKNVTHRALLYRIERFYDAVPRREASAEAHDGLTLFVRDGEGIPFYARPTLGGPLPDSAAVEKVRARQRELGVPEAFEWVAEVTPGLDAIVEESGLEVEHCPLMVLDPERLVLPTPPPGTAIEILSADSDTLADQLADLRAVCAVAFGAGGTQTGPAGPAERDTARAARPAQSAARAAFERDALRSGILVRAVLVDRAGTDGVLCAGTYHVVDGVAEIVGVATLPAARRRGLAAALTAALAAHALDAGVELVFLSAHNEDVARIYGRLGFHTIATACIAEPPAE